MYSLPVKCMLIISRVHNTNIEESILFSNKVTECVALSYDSMY